MCETCEAVTVETPLATFRGEKINTGRLGAVEVLLTEIVSIDAEVPDWAVHPREKLDRSEWFVPPSVDPGAVWGATHGTVEPTE